MFLSPLGERLGEGVNPETVSCIIPSPSLSPKGERSMKLEREEPERRTHTILRLRFASFSSKRRSSAQSRFATG
jgi:hypothetical protein